MAKCIPSPHEPTESWYNHIIPKENVDFKKKKTLQEKERNFLGLWLPVAYKLKENRGFASPL